MATVWRDKRGVYVLTNIHNPPTEGNFCNERGHAFKPQTVQDYNQHTKYDNDQQFSNPTADIEVDKKLCFPPVRHDYF
jgi:hypothetical protein